jgi:hypothetical protein
LPLTWHLIRQLAADDMWLTIRAALALNALGPPARKAVPDLLQLALTVDKQ